MSYWKGYLANGEPEWSEIASSAANTAITVTRAGEAGRTHYITTFEVALHEGTPNSAVEITLMDGNTVVWRTNRVGADAAVREHSWPHGLGFTEGNAVHLTVAAGGTGVIVDANLSGFTR